MKTKPLIFLLFLTFLFLFSGSSVVFGDDFQERMGFLSGYGLDAYNRKDYKTAYKLFLPLAEQGYAPAQHNLGVMYDNGQGVPQDYKEAVRWYLKSAEKQNFGAFDTLGDTYRDGLGVNKDNVYAYMWFQIGEVSPMLKRKRDRIAKQMTPAQIEAAKKLARECVRKKYKGCKR